MKKGKLNLDQLSIKSFITNVESDGQLKVKGGTDTEAGVCSRMCPSIQCSDCYVSLLEAERSRKNVNQSKASQKLIFRTKGRMQENQ